MKIKANEGQLIFKTADGDVIYIQQEMPWRLQIAAQLGSGLISRKDLNVTLSNENVASICLALADALIKEHEETK